MRSTLYKSLDFSQEQARIKAQGSIIQSHSSPHHSVWFSHLGRGGSYSSEKDCTLFKTFNCVEQQTHLGLSGTKSCIKILMFRRFLISSKSNQEISSTGYHRFQMNLSGKSRLTTILFLALLRDLEQFLITRINTSQP
ncbi:hypothetical protein TNCV_529051 [Trichonephila clavipes]|nr:hypothetical protein TNCV_529051 [Trichonephila clavipes]